MFCSYATAAVAAFTDIVGDLFVAVDIVIFSVSARVPIPPVVRPFCAVVVVVFNLLILPLFTFSSHFNTTIFWLRLTVILVNAIGTT